jgi:hypothetical protein
MEHRLDVRNPTPRCGRRESANEPSRCGRRGGTTPDHEQQPAHRLSVCPGNQYIAEAVRLSEGKTEACPDKSRCRADEQREKGEHQQAAMFVSGLGGMFQFRASLLGRVLFAGPSCMFLIHRLARKYSQREGFR